MSSAADVVDHPRGPASPSASALPRLLAGLGGERHPVPLAAHRRLYPPPPVGRRRRADLLAAVERSGLRGRGGAGFPTARKLRAVAQGRRPVVVVNGSEGEPASSKDKVLLQMAPHLVLDGALVAAAAVGATDVIVGVDRHATAALRSLRGALAERGAEAAPAVRVEAVPHRYVAGEESALVHWLNGGPAKPTLTPPRPSEVGVGRRPTLVDNVETLAHLAQIARFGPEWFRLLGTPDEPGSMLVTLSGAVARPGVYEVAVGAALAQVVGAAGVSGPVPVLVGGYYGSWLSPAQASSSRLSRQDLRRFGAGPGCGAVVALAPGSCGLAETARILAWMAGETAGQCGSCLNGVPAIAAALADLVRGLDRLALLHRWAGQVEGRGACRFPDGAVRLLRSALDVFSDDVDRHLCGRPCPPGPSFVAPPQQGEEPWR